MQKRIAIVAREDSDVIIDRETLNKFSNWYQDTALEELTGTTPEKLNSGNLGAVMKTGSKIGPEVIVDVSIELFNKIKHFEKSAPEIISTYFGTLCIGDIL